MAKELDLLVTPTEFFKEKISTAMFKQNLEVDVNIEYYLVNLLCNYIEPDKKNVNLLDTPLALIMKDGMEAPQSEKFGIFKSLGDTSLYISGYFQDYFNRKTYDIDYFITVGASAYSAAAESLKEKNNKEHQQMVFTELADNFSSFVEVFAIVSDELSPSEHTNLVATYDRWIKNNSERLRKKLEDSGIKPIKSNMKTKQ